MPSYTDEAKMFSVIKLPSNGVIPNYPKEIKILPLKVRDIKQIKSAPVGEELRVIVEILQQKISPEPQIDLKDLTLQDMDYILYFVRCNDIDKHILLDFVCSEEKNGCGRANTFEGDLSQLKETKLNKKYKEEELIEDEIKYRLPRVRDLLYFNSLGLEIAVANISDESLMAMALDCKLEEKIALSEDLPPKTAGKILSKVLSFDYGLEKSFETICGNPGCGRAASLILPFRRSQLFQLPLFLG